MVPQEPGFAETYWAPDHAVLQSQHDQETLNIHVWTDQIGTGIRIRGCVLRPQNM